jgi:hypothetical protein
VVEGRREWKDALEGDETERRLEASDGATRGRNTDRATRVRAERRVREAGGEGRRRSSARTARDAPGGDRVGNGAEVGVLRRDPVGELVEVRLPDVDVAGAFQTDDSLGRAGRNVVGEDRRAVGRRQTGCVEEILDRERDALRRNRLGPRQEDRVGDYESSR